MGRFEVQHLSHETPPDLLELYEVLEWEAALKRPETALGFGAELVQPGTVLDYGVRLYSRAEIGLVPPEDTTTLNPSFGTTKHWEGPHMGAFSHASCFTKIRGIQAFHMGPQRNWVDIAYTGLVCPHGYAFEGRGVFHRTAANGTNTGNNTAYAVCYLGGENDPFTEEAKLAERAFSNYLRTHGSAGQNVNCHRDWKATACPGDTICAWVDSGEPIPNIPEPEDDDVTTISIAWDPRNGAAWQITNFETRRWLSSPRQVDICKLYWASKNVPVDEGTWSPEDIDDKGIVPGTPDPGIEPAQIPVTLAHLNAVQ